MEWVELKYNFSSNLIRHIWSIKRYSKSIIAFRSRKKLFFCDKFRLRRSIGKCRKNSHNFMDKKWTKLYKECNGAHKRRNMLSNLVRAVNSRKWDFAKCNQIGPSCWGFWIFKLDIIAVNWKNQWSSILKNRVWWWQPFLLLG